MTLEALARKVMKLLENPNSSHRRIAFHNFPIRRICGIDVFVNFEFSNYGNLVVVFTIQPSDVRFMCDEYNVYSKTLDTIEGDNLPFSSITLEKITGYFEKILEIIPTLRLDKHEARLTDEPVVYTDELLELFKFENTELKYDMCVVCHEVCGTITSDCKHHLCIECCGKIAENEHECHPDGLCDDCGYKKCPVCRGDFLTLQKA